MMLATVVGTVVASVRADDIADPRYLLLQACDESGDRGAETLVALDLVGAGRDEVVLLCQGSSCRWTDATVEKPIDALIVAIVDAIDADGWSRYRKGQSEGA